MNARADMDPGDLGACRAMIRTGSHSFHAASRLLPARVRDPALVLYAFCRVADDAVDETRAKHRALRALERRLDAAYAGRPANRPVDRAFAAMVERVEMPRALPEALIEGLAWDAEGRRYRDLSGVLDYSARVAAAVGAMMCVLMGVRDPDRLARACDLGLAMQLTNIARDVGEDARAGRVFLPLDWLDAAGLTPRMLAEARTAPPALRVLVARLLDHAHALYLRAEPGIAALPADCRPGIYAARHVYAGIGAALARLDHDSIAHRARTTPAQKLRWLALASARAALAATLPVPATVHAPPALQAAWLVEAAARRAPVRVDALFSILAGLRARDLAARGGLHG